MPRGRGGEGFERDVGVGDELEVEHADADEVGPIRFQNCVLTRYNVDVWIWLTPKAVQDMPTISMFYGILIRMFFRDNEKHHAPHIHADYQGEVAVYSILDGSVLAGALPPGKHKLVVAWIEIHREDLMADWELAVNGKRPLPIRGLDQ